MKKAIALGLTLTSGILLYFYWYHIPGAISAFTDPIGENQPVVWEEGPNKPPSDSGSRPPNILLIVADDLGFNDVSFYGGGIAHGSVPTPTINSIAEQGIHFTNGYSAGGSCAPSRAALMTGRLPSRSGFEFTPQPPLLGKLINLSMGGSKTGQEYPSAELLGLPASELILPELLKQKGYHSIALGKWHLGTTEGSTPNDQGFDEFLGFLIGGSMFMEEDDESVVNAKLNFDARDKFVWANLDFAVRYNKGARFSPYSHMTDYLSTEAAKAIEANKNRPFFMYLAYNAPHTPLQAEKSDYDALSHISDHTERTYAAMLRGLDRGIEKVLAALEVNGIADNTLVIFTSDNGGADYVGLADINSPYRGWKATFFEGGIHTPLFLRWPEKIPAGSAYGQAVSHIDIFSTIIAAAGVAQPTDRVIDGKDIVSHAMTDDPSLADRPLYWRTGGYKVVQVDGWKLQMQEQNGNSWLFNLNDDPTEQVNLNKSHQKRFNSMLELLYTIDGEMREPLWPSMIEVPIAVDYTLDNLPEGDYETILWEN